MSWRKKVLMEHGFRTENSTYIIAEIGINHGGNIATARNLIQSAARTGVDAVKFQTYLTEKRVAADSPIFDILKKCELPFDSFGELKKLTEKLGMDFFSTPFDEESVACLEGLDCYIYKVASFDVTNKKFLKKVSATGKTVVLSVGMANIDEISEAYSILNEGDCNIALLHCVSAYPTAEDDANLAALTTLQEKFDCVIGQSDHTDDIVVPLYAIAVGAQIIEKHYMIDSDMGCVDAPVSITEKQMKKLVEETRRLERILGSGDLCLSEAEKSTESFRRFSEI